MGSGASKGRGSSEKLDSRERKLLIKTLGGHIGGINCMDTFYNLLLTGSDDQTARLWDLMTYECKVVLEGHTGYISCCKLWNGNFALTGSFDKTVRKWNTASGNCVLKLEHHSGVVSKMLLFGDFLFTSSYDSTAVCWNLRNGDASRIFRGHTKGVLPIAYVDGSDHDLGGGTDLERNKDALITGSMDRTAKMWNIASGSVLRTYRGHKGAVLCLTVDVENRLLFTGSTDNTIRKWNLNTGGVLKVLKGHQGSVLCLQLHHRLLYSASVDATARSWVAEFGDTTRKYEGHEHMISDMKYHHGIVFTGSGDNTVRAFDAQSGSLKRTFKGHKFVVNCLLPYENTMLSGSYDGTVKIWNIADLIKDRVGASRSTISSSIRSSATQQRRKSSEANSDSDVTIANEVNVSGRRQKNENILELANEISKKERRAIRKPRGGRVAPTGGRQNTNNNSIYYDEFNFMESGLQDLIETDDYLTESVNQRPEVNTNGIKPRDNDGRATKTLRNIKHASSLTTQNFTRVPSSDTFHRSGNRSLIKRTSSDLLTKRPRTESSSCLEVSLGVSRDLALVDEEMRMVAMETSSNTSGYRTADNNSPASPVRSSRGDNEVDKPKLRQKSSVSFSPSISMKENRRIWDTAPHQVSRIPTSTRTTKKPPLDRTSGERRNSSVTRNITSQERKNMEKEILDMV